MILDQVYKLFDMASAYLETRLNWPAIIFLFFAAYQLLSIAVKYWLNKELKKRKAIIDEIRGLPEKLNMVIEKTENTGEKTVNAMAKLKQLAAHSSLLRAYELQHSLNEDQLEIYRNEALKIVKKHKGNPYFVFAALIIQSMLFATLLLYMSRIHNVHYHVLLPVTTVILSFFTFATRKWLIFYVASAALSFWVYTRINPAVSVFILYTIIYGFAEKRIINPLLKRKEKEKNGIS